MQSETELSNSQSNSTETLRNPKTLKGYVTESVVAVTSLGMCQKRGFLPPPSISLFTGPDSADLSCAICFVVVTFSCSKLWQYLCNSRSCSVATSNFPKTHEFLPDVKSIIFLQFGRFGFIWIFFDLFHKTPIRSWRMLEVGSCKSHDVVARYVLFCSTLLFSTCHGQTRPGS